MVDSQAQDPRTRVAGAATFAVGGAAALALAVLVWVLGYVGSLPFGIAPGADPQQGSNLYLPLAAMWAAAALAALVSAAISRRSPMAAAILALAALVAGFAAPLLLTPARDGAPPVHFASLLPNAPRISCEHSRYGFQRRPYCEPA